MATVIRDTAKQKVATKLLNEGEIDVVQAQDIFMAGSSLAVCIHRLRKEGWPIISETQPGKSWVKYKLLPDEI